MRNADYARNLKAKFLADAIPAESFAAGANALTAWGDSGNYDFQSETPNGWPSQRQKKQGETTIDAWLHSDIKNAAFFYVYELFDKIVKGE